MAESLAALTPLQSPQNRRQERTHMFVAATLYCSAGSCPIHIRNMSHSGALIEGAVLPDVDTAVTLRRGSLQAAAKVIWRTERKAGVAFSAIVQVADWMSRNPPSHQTQVDEIVRGIRAQTVPKPNPAAQSSFSRGSALAMELDALQDELQQLENGLTGDIDVVAKHPEIQLLDIALQRIGRLIAQVQGC